MAEGYCPDDDADTARIYANLAVENFMPLTAASGVLDESEIANLEGVATGIKDGVCNAGSLGHSHTYSWNNDFDPTDPAMHPTQLTYTNAASTESCVSMGEHGGHGDTFEPFSLKKVSCEDRRFVVCHLANYNNADWKTTDDYDYKNSTLRIEKEMKTANVDLLKEAFAIKNSAVVTQAPSAAPTTSAPVAAGNKKMLYAGIAVVIAIIAVVMLKK
jgi:hypothetical protein